MTLEELNQRIIQENKNRLFEGATQIVHGDGNPHAEIMFIGEAPGAKEDELGKPFVGAAGKLLSEMLSQNGFTREDVYITNVVKCRPPGNRDPLQTEVDHYWPYLEKEIQIIQPKIIVLLGRHAMNRFFPSFKITQVHGKCYRRSDGIVYITLYHPAAALYNGGLKETLFHDFKKVTQVLQKLKEGVTESHKVSEYSSIKNLHFLEEELNKTKSQQSLF